MFSWVTAMHFRVLRKSKEIQEKGHQRERFHASTNIGPGGQKLSGWWVALEVVFKTTMFFFFFFATVVRRGVSD